MRLVCTVSIWIALYYIDGTLKLVACAILCGFVKLFLLCLTVCACCSIDVWIVIFQCLVCCDFGFTFDGCFGFGLAALYFLGLVLYWS